MKNNRLVIKNFGPISKATLDIKDMMVFIGPQSSGKSTLAKLITILNDFNFKQDDSITLFSELEKYNIGSYLKKSTKIEFRTFFFSYSYEKGKENKIDFESYYSSISERYSKANELKYKKILINLMLISIVIDDKVSLLKKGLNNNDYFGLINKDFKLDYNKPESFTLNILEAYNLKLNKDSLENLFITVSKVFPFIRPIDSMYVPAERTILPLISSNLAGLINNKIQLPNHIILATQEFEKAIQRINTIDLSIIGNLRYKKTTDGTFIYHNRNQKVNLKEASSGVQSILPILLLIESSLNDKNYINLNYVVEEPELNLYPEAQYKLTKYLVKNCLEIEDNLKTKNLIITTHSPYVLASVNNLLLADVKGKINEELASDIVEKGSWINPDKFNAYEVKNGTVKQIFNKKTGLIEETIIDDVSEDILDDFKDLASING